MKALFSATTSIYHLTSIYVVYTVYDWITSSNIETLNS